MPREVRDRLVSCHVSYVLHDHEEILSCKPIEGPADFAAHLGYELVRITKTVVVKRQKSATLYAAVVAPMTERLDFAKLSRVLGYRAELASASELETVTAYPKFGVSPIGLPTSLLVVISAGVLNSPTVLIGAGCIGLEIELTPRELIAATGGTVTDICRSA